VRPLGLEGDPLLRLSAQGGGRGPTSSATMPAGLSRRRVRREGEPRWGSMPATEDERMAAVGEHSIVAERPAMGPVDSTYIGAKKVV
jgi:hypothetical protein